MSENPGPVNTANPVAYGLSMRPFPALVAGDAVRAWVIRTQAGRGLLCHINSSGR
ncbi:hypothetical protein ABIE33_004900 [Ensifer sp. 4252]